MVSWPPETAFTLPLSSVTVMKPLPALLSTTAVACTGGPWNPRRGPAWRVEVPCFALLDGAAALPAMPATAPARAQRPITAPSRTRRDLRFTGPAFVGGQGKLTAQNKSCVGAR